MKGLKKRRPYWIKSDIYYCPLCMRESKYPERVYDQPKPKQWHERNHIIEAWDWCDAF